MSIREALLDSLEGLCTGDAFGQQFIWHPEDVAVRTPGVPPWHWTDDSEMAFSVCRVLLKHGNVNQDELAHSFASRFDPKRIYGAAMFYEFFPRLQRGEHWQSAARELFDGQGSYGNGAAMRVAPLGAFHADNLELVVSQALASAEVTHAHSEAIAGTIAVAVASALAYRQRVASTVTGSRTFLEQIIPFVPDSQVRDGLQLAYESFGPRTPITQIAERLGNGSHVTALDTVPLCLWIAGNHLHDFEEALWTTVAQGGDMDTNCAIVGGIVAANVGRERIPREWLNSREPIPSWATAVDDARS